MIYIFDSGPLIDMFNHFYPSRFPTLWENFDSMIRKGELLSVREVRNELKYSDDRLAEWAKNNKGFFEYPSEKELLFVAAIFRIEHFQALIRKKQQLQGKPVADPFVIAKANYLKGTVVTTERYKPNAASVPNVCRHFKIDCINLEQFMEKENWIF